MSDNKLAAAKLEQAQQHVREMVEDNPDTLVVYYGPEHPEDVLLLVVTADAPQTGEVLPFRFRDDPFHVLQVLLHPEDWNRRRHLKWPEAIDPYKTAYQVIYAKDPELYPIGSYPMHPVEAAPEHGFLCQDVSESHNTTSYNVLGGMRHPSAWRRRFKRIRRAARTAHEVNRLYCLSQGDDSQPRWEDAPEWQKRSAIQGVRFHMKNPEAGAAASHNNWLQQKLKEGWKYGPIKDPEKKEHPCMVPFEELPAAQQLKDSLFAAVVHGVMNLSVKKPVTSAKGEVERLRAELKFAIECLAYLRGLVRRSDQDLDNLAAEISEIVQGRETPSKNSTPTAT